jgi:hypothetical protein
MKKNPNELFSIKNSSSFPLSLLNANMNILISSVQKVTLILEEINSKISNKNDSPSKNYSLNHQMEENDDLMNRNNLGNINSKEIPDFFEFLKQYKDDEPFFQKRSFQFNPDAFEMFLVAYKKQRIQQREAISQAFFLYAYVYLTKEEFENIELLESNENNEDDNDKYNYDSIFN